MDTVIEAQDVFKSFKDKQAANGVSFSIARGSVTAMLGPNGAGKTTMLSMMLGLLEPTQGSVTVFGRSPRDQAVRERTGAMLQEVSVMERLKAREILSLVRSYYPHPLDYGQLVQAAGLSASDLNRYADKLSVGQKRSLGFALALAGNPDLLFFDEPTVGLDIGCTAEILGYGSGPCRPREDHSVRHSLSAGGRGYGRPDSPVRQRNLGGRRNAG